jgi:hypothetical protein
LLAVNQDERVHPAPGALANRRRVFHELGYRCGKACAPVFSPGCASGSESVLERPFEVHPTTTGGP